MHQRESGPHPRRSVCGHQPKSGMSPTGASDQSQCYSFSGFGNERNGQPVDIVENNKGTREWRRKGEREGEGEAMANTCDAVVLKLLHNSKSKSLVRRKENVDSDSGGEERGRCRRGQGQAVFPSLIPT